MVIAFCMGAFLGFILTKLIFKSSLVGSLRIDTSDPDDGPYLFLELSKEIDDIRDRKQINLKVSNQSYTHK